MFAFPFWFIGQISLPLALLSEGMGKDHTTDANERTYLEQHLWMQLKPTSILHCQSCEVAHRGYCYTYTIQLSSCQHTQSVVELDFLINILQHTQSGADGRYPAIDQADKLFFFSVNMAYLRYFEFTW